MQDAEKYNIFTQEVKPFSIRVPPILMENVAREAAEIGRSRDKQMIAILADRYGFPTINNEGE